jgi:hypothetical protein
MLGIMPVPPGDLVVPQLIALGLRAIIKAR